MHLLTTYARALGLLRGDRRVAILLALANLVVIAMQFVDPILFGRVIGLLSGSDALAPSELWRAALPPLGVWALVGLGGIVAHIAVALHADRLAHRNRLAVMSRYFGHVLTLPLSFHGSAHSGRIMKIMISGTDALFGLWLSFFREQLATAVGIIVLLPLTLLLNWRLASALIALVVVFAVLTLLVIRHSEAGQKNAEQYYASLAGTAQDAISNIMVVQAFTRHAAEIRRFASIAEQVIAHQFPVLTWWAVANVLTRAASTVAVIAIVVIGTILHLDGHASVGEIVSFIGFSALIIGRLESAMNFCCRLFMATPVLDEFFALLDTQSTVVDRPHAPALVVTEGAVRFEKIAFAYPGGGPTLRDISFDARPGSVVALVGATGAGKTTAMALLHRLWDPSAGRIAIDGQDLRHVNIDSLRRAIGVVFQESLLFNRSIRDNLLIGRPDATDAEIERACRLADAHEFILRQPQGYDTLLGERGANLSGGQRQRLAIARAALKDPPILILDEATSALDAATEARVSRALKALMAGRTTLIIAHRVSTVREADEILVFDEGRIVERGRYADLLARDGRFAALIAAQLAPPPAAAPHLPKYAAD